MEEKDVFISYKAEEFDDALWVKERLEEAGISCWMAPMSIRGGASYAEEIPQGIRGSRAFVLILSEKAQQSKWVPRELDQAINCRKVILPFALDNCKLSDEFGFYLSNVQRYDASRDREATMERMIRDLYKILGIEPPPKEEPVEEAPAEPPKQKEKKPDKKKKPAAKGKKKGLVPVILGAVLALAVLIVLLFPGTTKVGGVKIDRDAFSVNLEGVTITKADLQKLAKMPRLSNLRLKNCTITASNLSDLSLEGLLVLELVNCGLTDELLWSIDFSKIPHFRELNVSGNPGLMDFAPLSHCAGSLRLLDISGIRLSYTDWLAQYTKLETLWADETGLQSLEPLAGMVYLQELSLRGNDITSLKGLDNTSKLTKVNLSDNSLTEVSVLSRSAATLKELDLSGNKISDLSCLREARALREVSVDHNQLTGLDWLKGSGELRYLSASHNRIGSVAGLGIGEKLRYLDLSANAIEAIPAGSFAFGQGEFLFVDLGDNRLTTLQLPDGCVYKHLNLLGNPGLDVGRLGTIRGWNLYFEFPAEVTVETLQGIDFNGLCMVGCPLSRQVEMEEGLSNDRLMTLEEAQALIAEAAAEGY